MSPNKKKIVNNNAFWGVKKSGERLLWRFQQDEAGNFKSFTPNEKDYLALKSVLAWVNSQSSGILENSPMLAKLYLLQLVGYIRKNKTTVFNDFVFTEISNQLSKPLELFYTAFYEDLALNQLNKLDESNFKTKEGDNVVLDYHRFKETFPLDYVVSKLNERMIATLYRRS